MIRRAIKDYSIILVMIIFIMLAVYGCISPGQSAAEETGTPETEEESQLQEEGEEEETGQQPAEEVVEPVDLENAQFGAVLEGYIPSYMCTDTDNFIKVTVTNTSDFTWRAGGDQMVRLGYHFYGQDVEYQEYDKTSRTALPGDLEPGESAVVEVLINDVTNPGSYVIHIDLVVEGYAWFSSRGAPMLEGAVFFNDCQAQ